MILGGGVQGYEWTQVDTHTAQRAGVLLAHIHGPQRFIDERARALLEDERALRLLEALMQMLIGSSGRSQLVRQCIMQPLQG